MQCANHPGTEVYLRCGKCETPICPRCTVHAPTGARCRSCASYKASPLYQASARQYLLASLAALACGALLGWLPRLIILLGSLIYGYVVGEATLRGGGRRRGPGMQVVAGVAALVGILLWSFGGPLGLAYVLTSPSGGRFLLALAEPFTLIALILGVASAVVHVRYI